MKKKFHLQDLIDKCLKQDIKAQSFLMNFFWNDVKFYVNSIVKEEQNSEDITIETFTKVFSKLNSYNSDFDFKKWVISIAHNTSIDFIRKNLNYKNNIEYFSDYIYDYEPIADDIIIDNKSTETILNIIDNLEEKYRIILKLKYIDGLSIKEISEYLKISVSNTKVRLMRARNLLKI